MPRNSKSGQPGNMLAVKHGAKSPRIVAVRTAAIEEAWLASPEAGGLPLRQPVNPALLWATAAAMARLEELTEYLEGLDGEGKPRGIVDSRGRPRGCAGLYLSSHRAVVAGLERLCSGAITPQPKNGKSAQEPADLSRYGRSVADPVTA